MYRIASALIGLACTSYGRRLAAQPAGSQQAEWALAPKVDKQSGQSEEFRVLFGSPVSKPDREFDGQSSLLALLFSREAAAFASTFSRMSRKTRRVAVSMALVDQSVQAFNWMSSLRAPAALVAGAALSAGYSLDKDLQPQDDDKRSVSVLKKLGKLLFLSAFTLEIACVFGATVTGTMLLGKGVPNPLGITALDMLHREVEFEYLLCRVFFFQGLLHWLSAVAAHQMLPKKGMTKAARNLQESTAAMVATIMMYMVAFYNTHISYYANYGHMLWRLAVLTCTRNYMEGFRVLPIAAFIPAVFAIAKILQSLFDKPDSSEGESAKD